MKHLGAFGLGVPTSTLSQGSHITLMSKKSMDQELSFAAISNWTDTSTIVQRS